MRNAKVWLPMSTNDAAMADYRRVLNDKWAVYAEAVEKVRESGLFSDERAIQAAAFSIWKNTMDTITAPGLVFYEPTGDPMVDLRNFRLYRQGIADPLHHFVLMTSSIPGKGGDIPTGQIYEALDDYGIDAESFKRVVDYAALALSLRAFIAGMADKAEELKAKAFNVADKGVNGYG